MSGLRFGLSLSMQGRGGKAWRDYHLFETGSGFLYDFSRADALFQEATGITPAGVDQNVGLALDVSKWGGNTLAQVLAGQAELKGSGATGMTGSSTPAQYNTSTGVGQLTRTSTGNHSYVAFTVGGGSYRIAVQNTGASGLLHIRSGGAAGTIVANNIGPGASATIILPSSSNLITLTGGTDGATIPFVVSTFKEIPGNHASQATSGARSVLKAGGLTRYDGSDDRLQTPLTPSTSMSLAFRVYATNVAAVVLGGSKASDGRFYPGISATGLATGAVGTLSTLTGGPDIRNRWAVVVLTADGTTARLYVDGDLVASQAQSGAINTTIPIAVGCLNNNGSMQLFFLGDMSHALAINRALTPAEIVKLTNAWSY